MVADDPPDPRRVGDLTAAELRDLIAAAVEEGVRRARRAPTKTERRCPSPEMLERVAATLRRKGLMPGVSPPPKRRG